MDAAYSFESLVPTHKLYPHPTHLDPEVGGSMFLQNVDIHLQDHTVSQPKIQQYEESPLSELHNILIN
jgi:hypothetical protein